MRNGLILKSLHVFTTSTERLATFLFFSFSRERERWVNTPIQTKKKKRQGKTDQAGGLAYCTAVHQQCTLGFSIQGSHECDDATLCIRNEKKIKGSGKSTFFSFFLFLFCISRGIPASILLIIIHRPLPPAQIPYIFFTVCCLLSLQAKIGPKASRSHRFAKQFPIVPFSCLPHSFEIR